MVEETLGEVRQEYQAAFDEIVDKLDKIWVIRRWAKLGGCFFSVEMFD